MKVSLFHTLNSRFNEALTIPAGSHLAANFSKVEKNGDEYITVKISYDKDGHTYVGTVIMRRNIKRHQIGVVHNGETRFYGVRDSVGELGMVECVLY